MMVRTAPSVGAPPRLPPLDIRRHTFSNGLVLAVVENPHTRVVDVEFVVRAGASLDAPQQAGRAAMTAEMIDEGTTTRTALQIADEIDYLGAELRTSTGWDSTVVGLHVSSERLQPALEILADVLLRPTFPQEEFERKQREKLTELLQDRDEARVVANKTLMRGIFGAEHPYGTPAGGTLQSVQALTIDAVREFYRTWYVPANCFMVVAGDVQFATLVHQLEQQFGGWQGAVPVAPSLPVPPPVPATHVRLVHKANAPQAEIRVGHPAPPRSTSDYFALVVLNTMLGGSFTSRLNLRLREEMAVTYGASSRFQLRMHGGVFWASSAVDADAAAESVAVMLREMHRLQVEPLDVAEMQRAAQYVAYGWPRHFETTEDIAAHVREQLLYDLPDGYWSLFVDRILAVTPDQLVAAAARHLQPGRAVAVVVADRQVASALREQNIGDVVLTEAVT